MSSIHECFDNDLDPAWNKDMKCEDRRENEKYGNGHISS